MSRELTASEMIDVESMLVTVYDRGRRTDGSPDLETIRGRRLHDLDRLDVGVRRLINPHRYHVSITDQVKRIQEELIAKART